MSLQPSLSLRPGARRTSVVVLGAAILATAASGVTFATTSAQAKGYAACSTAKHVLVLRKHGACPHGSHKVSLGAQGPTGQGPAIVVTNPAEVSLSSVSDTGFHSVATLKIPGKGKYVASSKVVAFASGGSGIAASTCDLVAATSAAGTLATDESNSDLQNTGTVFIGKQTQSDEVAATFNGPGTVSLVCQQNGLSDGGADLSWQDATITATRVSALTIKTVNS